MPSQLLSTHHQLYRLHRHTWSQRVIAIVVTALSAGMTILVGVHTINAVAVIVYRIANSISCTDIGGHNTVITVRATALSAGMTVLVNIHAINAVTRLSTKSPTLSVAPTYVVAALSSQSVPPLSVLA